MANQISASVKSLKLWFNILSGLLLQCLISWVGCARSYLVVLSLLFKELRQLIHSQGYFEHKKHAKLAHSFCAEKREQGNENIFVFDFSEKNKYKDVLRLLDDVIK